MYYICRVNNLIHYTMLKDIRVELSARNKVENREIQKLVKESKTKTGEVGTVGKLRTNVFYRIMKSSIIIF